MGSERFFRTSMWFYNFKDVKNSNEHFKDPSHRKKTQVSYVPSKGSVIKNPPAKQETWVQSLHQEDLLEKETATHSSILPLQHSCLENPMDREAWWGKESVTTYRKTSFVSSIDWEAWETTCSEAPAEGFCPQQVILPG